MLEKIELADLHKQKQYRIIPSTLPTIHFFEDLVDPEEMETLIEIESLTNENIRQEVGELFLVPIEDRISGSGSSIVMAAFTHIYKPSRFTDGSYGVYYAGLSLETAIRETVFHREKFLGRTQEEPGEITMRAYEGEIIKQLHDIRHSNYQHLHDPDNYSESQPFGKTIRNTKSSWGVLYNSVRHLSGNCIAAFRPKTITIPKPISYLKYFWNGKRIIQVYDTKILLEL